MKFANVVVHVPLQHAPAFAAPDDPDSAPLPRAWLDRSFTYEIPEDLRDLIRVGQLVWAPFGARRLQGIVVELTETTEIEKTRPLETIVQPEPLVTLQQIELAQRISNKYLTPLSDCIWLFLPPGIEDKVETFIELVPDAVTGGLTEKQSALVERIRDAKSFKTTQLAVSQRGMVETLVRKGVLVKRASVRPARARPRHVDSVKLTVPPDAARARIAALDRRAAVIRALDAAGGSLTDAELAEQTRVTEGTLRRLERDKIIERVRPLTQYQLSEKYKEELPELPVAQARVSVYLREHGGRATPQELENALEISALTLKSLRKGGWVFKLQAPQRFVLAERQKVPPLSPSHERLLRIVELLAQEKNPMWVSALYAAADAKRADLQKLEQLGLVELGSTEIVRDPLAGRTFIPVPAPTLTSEQQAAWREIERALMAGGDADTRAFLLHGVTGSGKTEIYLDAIDRTLAQGKQAIALVPEISLTPQTIRRFGARFGERIGVIHSRLSEGERYDTWRRVRDGKIDVVIGARSALFAPLPRLGLVVIDEEHDASYKNDVEFPNQPGYHARDVALEMARRTGVLSQTEGVVVILGSATPDVETYARALRGEIKLLTLPQRVIAHESDDAPIRYQDLPPVEIVDLRRELREGNRSVLSRALQTALTETLARGEQAILFLNRRGSASAYVCRDCGAAVKCPRCNNPYTLHTYGDEVAAELVCHHCGRRTNLPRKCPNCGSTRIRGMGLGTEKLEMDVRAEFPTARPMRWDYDVTQEKNAHELLMEKFMRGEANVLIGTQMITKGLDLPRVTLVGVVNADTGLHLPDFRASERTFQLLTQVAGRAGRSARVGKAIVQTYAPEHYAVQLAARHDYDAFFERETRFRRETGYPPYRPMIRLLYASENAKQARAAAETFTAQLRDRVRREGALDVEVIGAAPAFFQRLRGRYRWHILLKGRGAHDLLAAYPPPPNWRIDVDPIDLL
ncbi:MAG: primosomal protein N' [Anaerolineae bacterium]|nr:primosomal protein N' [Anaerolineae bacterium]